jgi:hypothetical protein
VWLDTANRLWQYDGTVDTPFGYAGTIPQVGNGLWHEDGLGTAAQSPNTTIVDREYNCFLVVGQDCTLTSVTINIGAAFTTAGNVRAGIRGGDWSTGRPNATVLGDFGTVAATTGTKVWTGSVALKARRLYFASFAWQGGSAGTPTFSARNVWHPLLLHTNAGSPNPNTNQNCYYQAGVSGALPSSWTYAGESIGPAFSVKLTVP